MPLPVIPDVFRVTLLWNSHDGVQPRNVIHVRSTTLDEGQVGLAVLQSFQDSRVSHEPFELLNSVYTFDSVEVLPLDGSTAGVIVTNAAQPMVGQDTGNLVVALCNIVSFRTGFRGPRGRGRMYIGPCGEDRQNAGVFNSTFVADAQIAWDDAVTAFADNLVPLCVASYKHSDSHDVTTATVEAVGGTQRRRQDQLR